MEFGKQKLHKLFVSETLRKSDMNPRADMEVERIIISELDKCPAAQMNQLASVRTELESKISKRIKTIRNNLDVVFQECAINQFDIGVLDDECEMIAFVVVNSIPVIRPT